MKFVCTKENLSYGLMVVSKIIGSGNSLPVLNNTLLKTEKGRLKLSSTNLEMAINTWVGGKVEEEGEITIPARVLNDYISNLPAEKVTIHSEKQKLFISTDKTKTHINGLAAEEFPLIPEVGGEPLCKIKGDILKKAINEVYFATAFSETQPEISGVFTFFEDKTLTLAATDRYRLAEKKLSIEKNTEESTQYIIPSRAVGELTRLLKGDEEVEIYASDGQILFRTEGFEVISRLIDGQYPDYKQIIPTEFTTEASVKRNELIQALKAGSLFTADNNNILFEVNSDEGAVIVKSESAQTGDSEIVLDAKVTGQKNSIVFNYRYVLDVLNTLDVERVVLKMIDAGSPAAILPEGSEDYFYIVMPIKV